MSAQVLLNLLNELFFFFFFFFGGGGKIRREALPSMNARFHLSYDTKIAFY